MEADTGFGAHKEDKGRIVMLYSIMLLLDLKKERKKEKTLPASDLALVDHIV